MKILWANYFRNIFAGGGRSWPDLTYFRIFSYWERIRVCILGFRGVLYFVWGAGDRKCRSFSTTLFVICASMIYLSWATSKNCNAALFLHKPLSSDINNREQISEMGLSR